MELISVIINELTNIDIPLASPLLKTKVLASRMGNPNLLNWVNSELNGYEEDGTLPDYRVEYGVLMGNYIQNGYKVSNAQIPVPNISKEFKEIYSKIESRDSIKAIEDMVGKKNLAFSVSNDRKAFLENEIRNSGNHRFQIINLHIQIPVNFQSNIVSNVRSRLLEFTLQLEQEFGYEVDISTLQINVHTINHIMNTTIINSGDGAIVNNGNENTISAGIDIKKGDKEYLRQELIKAKVAQGDVDELLAIVDDELPISKGAFGVAVNDWIKKMLSKAVDGSWQVSIGAAGNILSEALQRHYGL